MAFSFGPEEVGQYSFGQTLTSRSRMPDASLDSQLLLEQTTLVDPEFGGSRVGETCKENFDSESWLHQLATGQLNSVASGLVNEFSCFVNSNSEVLPPTPTWEGQQTPPREQPEDDIINLLAGLASTYQATPVQQPDVFPDGSSCAAYSSYECSSPEGSDMLAASPVDICDGITDEQLLHLPVKDLNKLFNTLQLSVKARTRLRQRRRTLKNRGYAHKCRQRRQAIRSSNDVKNMSLESELALYKEENYQLRQQVEELQKRSISQ